MVISKWFIVPSLCAAIAMSSASEALAARKVATGQAHESVVAGKPALKPASASKHKKKSKKIGQLMSKKITLKPASIKKHWKKHKKLNSKH